MDNVQDNLYCDVCCINLSNESLMLQHTSGKKHLDLVRSKEERIRVQRKCGIYVRGFSPNLGSKPLVDYFARFGQVVWSKYGDSFLLLDYSSPAAASRAVRRQHYLQGRSLLVKYRELRPQREAHKVLAEPNIDNVLVEIEKMRELEKQVVTVSNCLLADASEHPVYDRVCRDLFETLFHSFPRCEIFPFGSTVTGLGFRSSDIDVYIAGIRHGDNNVPALYQIRNILRNSGLFTNAIVIANAKIPILKCVHTQSGMNCDINIRNMLGVCNSNLISYYLNLDAKIRMIMFVIKYWAKTHRMTGQNHLFTNYSLSLMLIFFLQVARYKVPSVFSLQDFRYRNIQDGWNGGFAQTNFHSKELRDVSLVTLLSEFFAFYSDFDYGAYVICPYLGVPMKKSDFKDPTQLRTSVFSIYKKFIEHEGNLPLKVVAPVCVQDVFEHTRNTTPIVSDSTLNNFVNLCRFGKKLCESETGLLYRLTKETPPSLKMELTKTNFFQFAVAMGVNSKYLEQTDRKGSWYKSVREFLLTVLRDFLRFEVKETTDVSSGSKTKKIEGQRDVHDVEPACSYKCATKLNLWQNRKATLQKIYGESLTGVIEKEMEVTKQLMELYKDCTLKENVIEFEVSLVPKYDPVQMEISVTKIESYKKTFKTFGSFFAQHFISWFEKYEKELNS